MRVLLSIILLVLSVNAFGQKAFTFEIEKLSKPPELIPLRSYNDICKDLIIYDSKLSRIDEDNINIEYNIITKSKAPDSLVSYGYHSFFYGMYQAYANHRPFVLSPDMIWLLISQGFARHVNANPEKLRKHFVNFSGKKNLVVESRNDLLKDTVAGWEEVFSQFTAQIGRYTKEELINTLSSDFSTTTPIEKVASQITIMEAMEPYFNFVIFVRVCGIPQVTLQGTTEYWENILKKTKKLSQYDLTWWTRELEPLLKEFINASRRNINKKFWRNMFKYHSQKKYGAPKIIDGWIVKFFPYDNDGKRNNLHKLIGGGNLPEEIVKVDLKYIDASSKNSKEVLLELWSGFIGLEQNPETYALTPKIGWMVRKKDIHKNNLHQKFISQNIPSKNHKIDLIVEEVPESLKRFKEIYNLKLYFTRDIYVPEWLKGIRIGQLEIEGKISKQERDKIISWFPKTDLIINQTSYGNVKNDWIVVKTTIPESLKKLQEIWILEILNYSFDKNEFIIPDWLKNIKIDYVSLLNETSPENIEKLKTLLPHTKIYITGKPLP